MKKKKLQFVLVLVLLITLALAWFAPSTTDDNVELSENVKLKMNENLDKTKSTTNQSNFANSKVENKPALKVLNILPRIALADTSSEESNLFTSTQWTKLSVKKDLSREVKKIVTINPIEESPPPLPFIVLGRYLEAGQEVFFLQHSNQNLVVRIGDTLINQYKVESIRGATLYLRYLPLNTMQTLDFSNKQ
jgi:hypothetical protein